MIVPPGAGAVQSSRWAALSFSGRVGASAELKPVKALGQPNPGHASQRDACMGINAAFIAFGLARSAIDLHILTSAVAYGGMLVVGALEAALVARYFLRRRVTPGEIAPAPKA